MKIQNIVYNARFSIFFNKQVKKKIVALTFHNISPHFFQIEFKKNRSTKWLPLCIRRRSFSQHNRVYFPGDFLCSLCENLSEKTHMVFEFQIFNDSSGLRKEEKSLLDHVFS